MINETHAELKESTCRIGPQRQEIHKQDTSPRSDTQLLAIASTFTAEAVRSPLEYWMNMLDIPAIIGLAPYAQVMQSLLAEDSLLSRNEQGFNILLLRLEDWIRDRAEASVEDNKGHIESVTQDFADAVKVLRSRTSVPILVFFGPSSSSIPRIIHGFIENAQRNLAERLAALRNVYCWSHSDLIKLYPVAEYEDLRTDRLGHIPYVPDYFTAVATLLARRITALVKPRHKVIAVDCDKTLWKGICGEDGESGIELTPAHLEFQKMLVRQHDAGMLLCLCSKNNAGDIEAVFRSHPEMPLREEHLICSRVNWRSKSSNLESIADELGLSLDSFVFIDDSPIECAEVRARCPSVLTLEMPENDAEIEHFTNHVWAFDRIGVTTEAKKRTVQYRQNQARTRALRETIGLDEFLASLDLKIETSMMQVDELARVAELVHRTNQFNLTGNRRSSSEIESLWNSGDIQIAVVRVRDRFGDYGLVGAVLFRYRSSLLEVDTFVLSCRVLGRGVERRILSELGRIARQEKLTDVLMRYRPTTRNTPAWEFLQKTCSQFRSSSPGNGPSASEVIYRVPAEAAERIGSEPAMETRAQAVSEPVAVADSMRVAPINHHWHDVAYRFSRLPDIVGEVKKSIRVERCEHSEYIEPRTPMEVALAKIWAEVLGVDEVSVQADFFELGGDSLLAVQVIAHIESIIGVEISIYQFFENPTVTAIAEKLEAADQSNVVVIGNLDRLRQEIDHMSDDVVRTRIAELEKELGETKIHVTVPGLS